MRAFLPILALALSPTAGAQIKLTDDMVVDRATPALRHAVLSALPSSPTSERVFWFECRVFLIDGSPYKCLSISGPDAKPGPNTGDLAESAEDFDRRADSAEAKLREQPFGAETAALVLVKYARFRSKGCLNCTNMAIIRETVGSLPPLPSATQELPSRKMRFPGTSVLPRQYPIIPISPFGRMQKPGSKWIAL